MRIRPGFAYLLAVFGSWLTSSQNRSLFLDEQQQKGVRELGNMDQVGVGNAVVFRRSLNIKAGSLISRVRDYPRTFLRRRALSEGRSEQ
jgi:hypothetical protein